MKWLRDPPEIKKPTIRLIDDDFDFLKTDTEIARFLAAAFAESEKVYVLYATAIYTGLREGELAGLKRDRIDLSKRLITVQFSYDGPTKSSDLRRVPILDPLLPILRSWLMKNPGPFVFPSEAGTMLKDSARIFQEVMHRVIDRAGFPKVMRDGRTRRYITFHDLRHTFASHWMMNGGDIFRLQKILGHKDPKMTMRYSHLAPDAFTSDYSRLGQVAPGTPATVRQIHPLEASSEWVCDSQEKVLSPSSAMDSRPIELKEDHNVGKIAQVSDVSGSLDRKEHPNRNALQPGSSPTDSTLPAIAAIRQISQGRN